MYACSQALRRIERISFCYNRQGSLTPWTACLGLYSSEVCHPRCV